jgi:hypothetical protein
MKYLKKRFVLCNYHIISIVNNSVLYIKEARLSVEDMLQSYKNEVDTLNEALKIAAQDIAEVAEADDDFFLSDEDEGSNIYEDAETLTSSIDEDARTGVQQYQPQFKKNSLYNEIRKDSKISTTQPTTTGTARYLIHEDGTFEHK